MYQLDETGMRRDHRRELREGPANAPRLTARRAGSGARLRVVLAPGGFAFVADKGAAERGLSDVWLNGTGGLPQCLNHKPGPYR